MDAAIRWCALRHHGAAFRDYHQFGGGVAGGYSAWNHNRYLSFRIRSVQKAKENKYILLNTPNKQLEKIVQILPGMNSPTILPLAKEGWSSLHSVISEEKFWEIIDELKVAGAEGILVVPIEKMIL